MEKLSILAAVQTEDGTYQVEIALSGGDREIVRLLNAIERHVEERRAGPARISLNGRNYTLDGASYQLSAAGPGRRTARPAARIRRGAR